MKNYLLLVKHSLPEIKKSLPAREWELSETGRLRAHLLAERLRPYQPEAIVSSIEPKAVETAKIIAGKHELGLQIVEDLHEHDREQIPYLSRAEFEMSVRQFFINPDRLVFGSETANEAHLRFSQAVHSILNIHQSKTTVVVSHGTVISLFVSRLTGISDLLLWNELGLPGFVVLDMNSSTLITRENIV